MLLTAAVRQKYYVNDRLSTWTEVTDLFKSKGVDLDNNRFLILQGEVEAIAMMKPKAPPPTLGANGQMIASSDGGLLEFLEEIIGTNRYIESINQSIHALELLNYQRTERLNRLKLAESNRNELQGARDEALEYVMVDHQVNLLKATRYQKKILHADEQKVLREQQRNSVESELQEKQRSLKQVIIKLNELEADYQAKRSEWESLEQEVSKVKQELTKLERQDTKLAEDRKHHKQNLTKLNEKVTKLQKSQHAITDTLRADTEELPIIEAEVEKLTVTKQQTDTQLEKLYETLKDKTEQFRKELEVKQKQLLPLQETVNTHQQSVKVTQADIALLSAKTDGNRAQLDDVRNKLASAQNNLTDTESKHNTLSKQVIQLKQQLDSLKSQYEAASTKEHELTAKRGRLLSTVEGAESITAQLPVRPTQSSMRY